MTVRESLVVERLPFGMSTFSLCRGWVLTDGTLIVEVIETGRVIARFHRSRWQSAHGVGVMGHTLYDLHPDDVEQRRTA